MTKPKKKSKKAEIPNEELLVNSKVDPKEYEKYVREHARRLKQLEREARGFNMESPE
jgi:hypothetical protein